MDSWIIFALLAVLCKGVSSFIFKMLVEKNINFRLIYIFGNFLAGFFLLFFIDFEKLHNLNLILVGFLQGLLIYLLIPFVYKALQNISSSTYFINMRIFSTILLFFSGMIFFNEYLTIKELLGIFFGILVFILLYDKKDKPHKNSNIKLGIFLLTISIILSSILNINNKIGSNFSVIEFLFIGIFFTFLIFLIDSIFRKNLTKKNLLDKNIFIFSIIKSITVILIHFFLFTAYTLNDLVIVYKIFSFEIIIPIILSIIIYKEKITLRKILAFALTITSIWFFL